MYQYLIKTEEGKDKAASLSLRNELYNKIARLEWRVCPELLRLSARPHWANQTYIVQLLQQCSNPEKSVVLFKFKSYFNWSPVGGDTENTR